MALIFVIRRCKYYKTIIIWESYICPVKAFWEDIFMAYIALNPISFFFSQIYLGDPANFAGSSIIFFFIVAHIIRWFRQIVEFPRRTWLLLFLRFFFFDERTWWCIFLSLSPPHPQFFLTFFAVANLLLLSHIINLFIADIKCTII